MLRALFSTPRAGCSLHKHDHMLQGPSPGEVPGSAPCLSSVGTGPGDAQPAAGTGEQSPTPARAQPEPRQGRQHRSPPAKPAAVSGLRQPTTHPRRQHGQEPGVRTATPRSRTPRQDTQCLPGATAALTAAGSPAHPARPR